MPDPGSAASADPLKRIAGSISNRINTRRSLDLAARRQLVMLPEPPAVPGYEFAFAYRPAEHVSGDFCDIIDIGEGRYGLLVGDICGHGVEAGVIMGSARKALQIYARSGEAPATVLAWGNEDLRRELDRATFLTAAYSILDTATHTLRYVRAGHPHPLVMGPGHDDWQVVKSDGTMIGITGNERFSKSLREVTLSLQPGQDFIQYTDGLTEARERGDEEFGIDRMMSALETAMRSGGSLQATVDALLAEVDAWTGGAEQEDDISILAVRRCR